jgi:DNA polymerase elongation subunit (family B)
MGGQISQIHLAYYAASYDLYLKDFIENLIQIRNRGNIYKSIGKLLINSFYGRLGLQDSIDLTLIVEDYKFFNSNSNIQDLFKHIQIKSNPKANIAVAASITSKARIKLYRTFLEIKKKGGRVLYCDTDSIFAAFPNNLNVENTQIGEIIFDTTNELTQISNAVFAAPKTYALQFNNKELIRLKGFNISTDYNTFQQAFYNNQSI